MAVAATTKSRLFDGRLMTCPRCREKHNAFDFISMGVIEEFRAETNLVCKCPECRWIFSPLLTPEQLIILRDSNSFPEDIK